MSRLSFSSCRDPRLLLAAGVVWLLAGCASRGTGAPPSAEAVRSSSAAASLPAADAPGGHDERGVMATDRASTEQRFAEWVARFRESARAAGIDEATLREALDTVRLRPRAVEADRSQPEFTRTLWDYLDAVVSPQRVAMGQQKLVEWREPAQAAAARYGVPAPVLMAVWGIESNYGRNYGDVPVVDALATLGFEGRREAWARSELMAALRILQNKDIDRVHMVGSWAGAMGQTQFMPSSFLAYAVDADGDGRRDIWGSMPDVLASTANYLARAGWKVDEPWGAEVRLPAGFDPARADNAIRQSASQWAMEGVTPVAGGELPAISEASILLPAGARGPAFLVGRNFRALLRYNNATSYALTVSLLSQRIAGGPGVAAAWPRDQRALNRAEIQALQTGLNRLGFDSGTPDGQFGPASRQALRAFQRSQGLPADGHPTAALLQQVQQMP